MFLSNLIPSWSSFIFLLVFSLGSYNFITFIRQRKKGKAKVASFLWGTFFTSISLFFLGNEYHLWSFLTAKSTIVGVLGFFSLALILSTVFIEKRFYRIAFWVPAVVLIFLSLLAVLIFTKTKILFIPLWSVNFIFIALFVMFISLRLFIKKGKIY